MSNVDIDDIEREMYVCTDLTDREKRMLKALQEMMTTLEETEADLVAVTDESQLYQDKCDDLMERIEQRDYNTETKEN